jgi:N-dimethylarginine dimethylaminohydrolase
MRTLIELLNSLKEKKISAKDYIEKYGKGALEFLKNDTKPKEEDLTISKKDRLLSRVFKNIEDIKINLAIENEKNPMMFNIGKIKEQQREIKELEGKPVKKKIPELLLKETQQYIPTGWEIVGYWESIIKSYIGIKTEQGTFLLDVPILLTRKEICENPCFVATRNCDYIVQFKYNGSNFTSFRQRIFELLYEKKEKIEKKISKMEKIKKVSMAQECVNQAFSEYSTYISQDLSDYSLWLMSRQFKIEDSMRNKIEIEPNEEGSTGKNKIFFDTVTGSFGNIGSKYSLKHGVSIKLNENGFYVWEDENITEKPYSTERIQNIYPSRAGYKRINVTDIQKSPLKTYSTGEGFKKIFKDPISERIKIKELENIKIPEKEEISILAIVADITGDMGSIKTNVLDMFNVSRKFTEKIMTEIDIEPINEGSKVILPFREKAVIGGIYGKNEKTQVKAEIRLPEKQANNFIEYMIDQEIEFSTFYNENETIDIIFEPDLILNHSNRDNNIALRLMSNIRMKSILNNEVIEKTLDEFENETLKENDEYLVKVQFSIGKNIIAEVETQMLCLTAYHQPTHTPEKMAKYGIVNITYRQAISAMSIFAPKEFNKTVKNFNIEKFKARAATCGYEIVETEKDEIEKQSQIKE